MSTEAGLIIFVVIVVWLVFLILALGAIGQYHNMSMKHERIQAEANEAIARVRD